MMGMNMPRAQRGLEGQVVMILTSLANNFKQRKKSFNSKQARKVPKQRRRVICYSCEVDIILHRKSYTTTWCLC